MAKTTATDIIKDEHRRIVEQIVADMENEGFGWVKSWNDGFSPMNAVTHRPYNGGNRFMLSFAAMINGYDDPRWCTYKQASEAGWQVKKGAKSAIVEHWDQKRAICRADGKIVRYLKRNEKNPELEDGQIIRQWYAIDRFFNVFNACEIEGIPELDAVQMVHEEKMQIADRLIGSSRCKVLEVPGDSAYYAPGPDHIVVPVRNQFDTAEGFITVLLHEMTHSTDKPLKRGAGGMFGSVEYAFEELVAELGSAFASSDLGVEIDADRASEGCWENHVAYIANWMQLAKDDPEVIFKAARLADRACTYILDRYSGQCEKVA